MVDLAQIRADVDRLAILARNRPPAHGRDDAALLAHVPRGGRVRELGGGTGAFTRQHASRAAHVTAIDLSPELIARARTRVPPTCTLAVADLRTWVPSPGTAPFDTVVAVAVLHHLPLAAALRRCRR